LLRGREGSGFGFAPSTSEVSSESGRSKLISTELDSRGYAGQANTPPGRNDARKLYK